MLRSVLARSVTTFRTSLPLTSSLIPRRTLHVSSPLRLQNIFEAAEQPPLAVQKLTAKGFHLSDGLVVPGGVVFVDGRVFMWNVDPPVLTPGGGVEDAWKGWNKDAFSVFETIVPRPGSSVLPPPKSIREYLSSLGIQLDVMDSRNAASTYNLLFEEGRTVAAALCPLKPVNPRTGGPR